MNVNVVNKIVYDINYIIFRQRSKWGCEKYPISPIANLLAHFFVTEPKKNNC